MGSGGEGEAKLPGFWAAILLPSMGSPSHRSPWHGRAYPASLLGVSAPTPRPAEPGAGGCLGQPLGVRRDLGPNRLTAQHQVPGRLSAGRPYRDAAELRWRMGRATWTGSIRAGRASPGRSLAPMHGCTLRPPHFPPSPNPPGDQLGPVQARGGGQHRLLQRGGTALHRGRAGHGHGINLGHWCSHHSTPTFPIPAPREVGVSPGRPLVWLS